MPKTQLIKDHHLWTRDTIKNVSGNVTLDIAGDITLKPTGGDITFNDGTSDIFKFDVALPTLYIYDDADTDGVRDFFSITVGAAGETTFQTYDDSAGNGAHLVIDPGGNATINSASGDILLDAASDITLDADGDQVTMKFGGATGQIDFSNENSGDGIIRQMINAKDLVIQQFDGNEVARFTDGGDLKVTNTIYFAAETANTIGDGATGAIDWNVSQKQKVTITGTGITCNFTDPAGACNLLLKVVQGDGSDIIETWDVDIKWPSNDTVPTLSTGNGDVDIISFYFDGTKYYGVATLDFA